MSRGGKQAQSKNSKQIILIIIILGVILGLILLLIPRQTTEEQIKKKEAIIKVDLASAKGLAYLQSAYTTYSYNDKYLTYVYPGEQLACPLATPCNVTYRLLDAYFDVYFLEEVTNASALHNQLADAHAVIQGLQARWENEKINNVIKSDSTPGGVALDTYCILGFITKNKKMAEVARTYLTDDLEWMPADHYQVDTWRNIADESWCIRHFIAVDLDKELEKKLIDKLIIDTTNYVADKNISDLDKLSVIYHVLYILSDYEKTYKDNTYHQKKLAYSDFIHYYTYKKISGNNLMLANLLDVMVVSDYDNPAAYEEIASSVLDAQEEDGSWKISPEFPPDEGQVFTTFRAIIGLNQYKKYLQKR